MSDVAKKYRHRPGTYTLYMDKRPVNKGHSGVMQVQSIGNEIKLELVENPGILGEA